jgi:nucleoside-diphosphate-sugar epimerase
VTVLVTGGSGLVGSHVVAALRAAGEPVRAIARPRAHALVASLGAAVVDGDVADAAAWHRAMADGSVRAIVHAAALVAPRAPFAEFERVNVGATRLAVAAAQAAGARLVHVSSVAVYGRTAYAAGRGAVGEDFPFQPLAERDFYARTKRAAEELVRLEAGRRPDLAAVAIRPNVIYGERDRLFTPRVIATVRRRFVPGIGAGTNSLSCVYAGNVADAILAALERGRPGFRAYNVTRDAGELLSQRAYFEAFADALGVRLRRIRVPVLAARAGLFAWNRWLRLRDPARYGGLAGAAVGFMIRDNPFDTRRITAELGWRPRYETRDAIARTVRTFVSAE